MKLKLIIALMLASSVVMTAQFKVKKKPIRLISSSEHVCMNAEWAPDGQMIAFTAEKNTGIYLCDKKGKNVRLLTNDENAGFGFSWSEQGGNILVRSLHKKNGVRLKEIALYDVKSYKKKVLIEANRGVKSVPQFIDGDASVVLVVDRKLQRVSTGLPGLKSGEKQKAVIVNSAIMKGDEAVFSNNSQFEGRYIFNQTYSPNGKKVAFQVNGLGLYVANLDGTELTHLGYGEQASWLPDNQHLLVAVVKDDGNVITEGLIEVVNVNTAVSNVLLADSEIVALNPSVSPDGTKVLIDNVTDGAIYMFEIEK
ncbi:MAG: hypothetical protein N4A71_01445 [Carboxylicivirga sp.]|jgi:Tol biopolymer transport system component|nr:hypothetical protein [Carboxylicivirga sp.]